MKHDIAQETSPPKRAFEQNGGGASLTKGSLAKPKPKVAPWPVTLASGPPPGRRGKKILLRCMIAASVVVVASWAIFAIKPSWLAELKGRLPFHQALKKRSLARHPARPVFKVVQPQRTNPLPPTTPAPQQPPLIAEQMERPQTSPPAMPPSALQSAPPSASPFRRSRRPQVSTPGAAGTPPSMPPSSAYPGTRPDLSVPGAPGIAPSISPSSVSPVPGEVQRPAVTSTQPSKKEESESDDYLEIATLYAKKGKYQKAEELFQKVAKENPSSAKAHNNLGVVRLKLEKYDMAEREFKEAMRLDPAFVLPYYNLACLYSRKGVTVDALIYLKKALKRDERVKQWVKTDKDFDRLRSDVVFQELVGGSSPKKEGAQKQESIQKQEETQKLKGAQGQKGIQSQDAHVQESVQTQEGDPLLGAQRKAKIPPKEGPQQQVIPPQEEIQKQEGTQGNTQDGAQMQEGQRGGAQGGAAK